MITSTNGWTFLIALRVSIPFMPGILTSKTTMSMSLSLSSFCRASAPLNAFRIVRSLLERRLARVSTKCASSSTKSNLAYMLILLSKGYRHLLECCSNGAGHVSNFSCFPLIANQQKDGRYYQAYDRDRRSLLHELVKRYLVPGLLRYTGSHDVCRGPDDCAVPAETCSEGKCPPEHTNVSPRNGLVQKSHNGQHSSRVRDVVYNRGRKSRNPQDNQNCRGQIALTDFQYPISNGLQDACLLGSAYHYEKHDKENERRPFNLFFQQLHDVRFRHEDDEAGSEKGCYADLHVKEPVNYKH